MVPSRAGRQGAKIGEMVPSPKAGSRKFWGDGTSKAGRQRAKFWDGTIPAGRQGEFFFGGWYRPARPRSIFFVEFRNGRRKIRRFVGTTERRKKENEPRPRNELERRIITTNPFTNKKNSRCPFSQKLGALFQK